MSDWLACMRRGDFEAAWRVSDLELASRRGQSCWHLPRHHQWVWDGRPFDGRRVLVRCYHGLGDTVQFARYLPMLWARAAHVTLWTQPALLELLGTMRGGFDALLPLTDSSPECAYEVDVELMELPHVFRTTLQTIPASVPYLHVEPVEMPTDGQPNVGIVWRSGDWDDRRSIPFPLVRELADAAPGARWHVLQRGPGRAEWDGSFGIDAGSDDPLAAARVVAALDLVVTVDSFPAHLAGALAVPTWTLLPHEADWRWMADREDTPWYPTMRLFRQPSPGDWAAVLRSVGDGLAAMMPR